MTTNNEELSREYWSKRIYDEVISDKQGLYKTCGFDYKNIEINDNTLLVDVQLKISFDENNSTDNIQATLRKIQKTLEILLKTEGDNR